MCSENNTKSCGGYVLKLCHINNHILDTLGIFAQKFLKLRCSSGVESALNCNSKLSVVSFICDSHNKILLFI